MGRYYPEHLPEDVRSTIKETESHVKRKMDAWHTDRSNFAETVIMDQVMRPLDQILRNWDEMVDEFASHEGDKDRNKAIAKLTDLVRQRSEVIKAYMDEMTPADMRLTLENLAKMEQYGEKFSKILTLTTSSEEEKKKFAWVEDALRYVMGLPGVNQNGSVDANKPKVYDDIVQALENPPKDTTADPEPGFSYACTLLAFAKPKDRKAIVKIALGKDKMKDDLERKKKLLETLCNQGAVSPLEADEALGKNAKGENVISDKDLKEMGKAWEKKYDYVKRAKYLAGESYGAKNMANEMLSLGNVLTTFGYIAGSMTILLNGICNWKKIKEDPSAFFKITHVWTGVAEVALAAYCDSDKNLGEITAGKETIQGWDTKKSQDNILSVVSASPRGWKDMLEGGNYFGVRALAEFVGTRSTDKELKEKEATAENFKEFLKAQKAKTPEKNYDKILAQVEAIEKGEGNAEVTSTRFLKLARAFSKLEIVGNGDQVITTYKDNLAAAKGEKTMPTAPTTTAQAPAPAPVTPVATAAPAATTVKS